MHALRFNLVLSEAQNCYAKDRIWKSIVREISLAMHNTFVFLKLSSYVYRGGQEPLLTPLKYATGY